MTYATMLRPEDRLQLGTPERARENNRRVKGRQRKTMATGDAYSERIRHAMGKTEKRKPSSDHAYKIFS